MTTADATALTAERNKLLADAGRIIDRCRAEGGRGMNAEESAEFDRLHGRAADLRAGLDAGRPDRTPAAPAGRTVGTHRGRPVQVAPGIPAAGRTTPAYAVAFADYLIGRTPDAAMQTDLGESGGYLAPPAFAADVVRELDTRFWFRSLATVLPPTAAPKVVWPRRLVRPDAFRWATELAPPSPDAGLKFGTFALTPRPMRPPFRRWSSWRPAARRSGSNTRPRWPN